MAGHDLPPVLPYSEASHKRTQGTLLLIEASKRGNGEDILCLSVFTIANTCIVLITSHSSNTLWILISTSQLQVLSYPLMETARRKKGKELAKGFRATKRGSETVVLALNHYAIPSL